MHSAANPTQYSCRDPQWGIKAPQHSLISDYFNSFKKNSSLRSLGNTRYNLAMKPLIAISGEVQYNWSGVEVLPKEKNSSVKMNALAF